MQGVLIESGRRVAAPSRGSVWWSVLAHAAGVSLLVLVSGRGEVTAASGEPPEVTMYVPTHRPDAAPGRNATGDGLPGLPAAPDVVLRAEPSIQHPRLGFSSDSNLVDPADFAEPGSGVRSPGGGSGIDGPVADEPAVPLPGNAVPSYPESMRSLHVTGSVRVRFVVTHEGTVDSASIRVLASTHEAFTRAMMKALVGHRFVPARAAGKAVPVAVERTFEFVLK